MARRWRFLGRVALAVMAAGLAGCGSSGSCGLSGDGDDAIGIPDVPDDTIGDVRADLATDGPDVRSDALPDGTPDLPADVPTDAAGDAIADADSDAPSDAIADAAPDALPDAGPPPATIRFAVVSDTHLVPDTGDERDRKWVTAMNLFRDLTPAAEMVFDTGDNVEVLLSTEELTQDYLDGGPPIEMLEVYRQLIQDHTAPMAYQVVLGNHDDRYLGEFTEKTRPLAAWLKAFQGTPWLPAAYYSVERRGCLFVVLDSTDLASSHDTNDSPTFGQPQLDWLDGELSRGLPTTVFWHHWIDRPADGTADADMSPVLPVLRAHKGNVKMVFTGHGHEWRRAEWEGIRFFETTSLFEHATPVYHLVECDPERATLTVLNESDIPYL